MTDFDRKIIDNFQNFTVRKELTSTIRQTQNVPTYVLEYLLGKYCCSEDEDVVKKGFQIVQNLISKNCVQTESLELIKQEIREKGSKTIIDKISATFDEYHEVYKVDFQNLKFKRSLNIDSRFVNDNEKILQGGIWCAIKIEYDSNSDSDEIDPSEDERYDIFGNRIASKQAKKKEVDFFKHYNSKYKITGLSPIQVSRFNKDIFIEKRINFNKDEWIDLLIKTEGYNPNKLNYRQKIHYLLRMVPLAQKNYNLVELGPRGTGKSHLYSELSPCSILISGGITTTANLFYNMATKSCGLVGSWDCIAFDEVAMSGTRNTSETIQTSKNYMANGSFARGKASFNADASLCYEGNIDRPVSEILRTNHLFEPFSDDFNNDSAFFDRIHAYLPGWETPVLNHSYLEKGYALISDLLSEFLHSMRQEDYSNIYRTYFRLNNKFSQRDEIAVSKTFSGLCKIIYPDKNLTKEQVKELLTFSIEYRRRVKEQLKKMNPTEFMNTSLGIIDLETNEETLIEVLEQPNEFLISQEILEPGFVYGIGKGNEDFLGVYRLEFSKVAGTGKFGNKNIEGIVRNREVIASLNASLNCFKNISKNITNGNPNSYDYSLYFNDLQTKGPSNELSVAEVVGFMSTFTGKSVLERSVIIGRVFMSGALEEHLSMNLAEAVLLARDAGAENIILPKDAKNEFEGLNENVTSGIKPYFYKDPIEACKIALKEN